MVKDYRGQVVNYFVKNLKKGYTPDALKFSLITQGYSRAVIDHALGKANEILAEKAPVLKERPVIRHEIIDEHNRPVAIKRSWWRIFSW